MRRLRTAIRLTILSLLLTVAGSGEMRFSPVELAAAPHRYDLLLWELGHLPDKWLHKLDRVFPWNSLSKEERRVRLLSYFELGKGIGELQRKIALLASSTRLEGINPAQAVRGGGISDRTALQVELRKLQDRHSSLRPDAEEALESELSAVLAREGISSWKGFTFPPVDLALSAPPKVLVVSPRDRIERLATLLLEPDLNEGEAEKLEATVFSEQDLSALVLEIGGVATYPSTVSAFSSLRGAAELAAHEWLHAYWFFRPLGWKFWSWDTNMNTLNETAADLAGREIGDQVYAAITGQAIWAISPHSPAYNGEPLTEPTDDPPPEGAFEFNREMRVTRLRVDELLAQGVIEEAERYMEERRLAFVAHGHPIRVLNQAYFAFHGTYAFSPASVSPIGDEVMRLRRLSPSVGDFVRTMAGFGSYREFQEYLSALGGPTVRGPHPHAPGPLGGVL